MRVRGVNRQSGRSWGWSVYVVGWLTGFFFFSVLVFVVESMETLLYAILTCMIDDTMPLYLFVFVLFFLHISLLCRHFLVLLCFFFLLCSALSSTLC